MPVGLLRQLGKRDPAPCREHEAAVVALDEPSFKELGPDHLGHYPFSPLVGQLLQPAQLGKTNRLIHRWRLFRSTQIGVANQPARVSSNASFAWPLIVMISVPA
jgi:hypothetical protein